MVTRVADLANNRLVQSLIFNAQDRIADRQLQISTLQKSQDYAGIAGDSSRLVTLEASRTRIDQFMSGNTFIELRMNTMLNSIDTLKDSLQDVKNLVREILDDGATPDGVDKDDIAEIKMAEIEDFLNVKINGRFLFAGSKTDTEPVSPGTLSTAPTFDGSNTTEAEPAFYYKGDDTQISARIDEGVVLEYGIKADDPSFEKLIRAVRIVRSTALNDANADAKFQHALDLINEASDRLQALELSTGVKVQQLSTTNQNLKDSRNFMNGIISDLESANTFEAVAELTQDQTMLEASYNTVVRLSNLSLNNFL